MTRRKIYLSYQDALGREKAGVEIVTSPRTTLVLSGNVDCFGDRAKFGRKYGVHYRRLYPQNLRYQGEDLTQVIIDGF